MTDFVFSQLEDISNDTFAEFSPYSYEDTEWNSKYDNSSSANYFDKQGYESPQYNYDDNYGCPSSNNNNNGEMCMYDDDQEYYTSGHGSGEVIVPPEIKLKDIDLHDYHGRRIEHIRVIDIKLKLYEHFFGLEYVDSIVGKAVSQFFPHDITTVVRQCDRIGVFLQFRRGLTCRKFSDALFGGDLATAEQVYYNDSPFVHSMYVMLEFVDGNHINYVFDYLSTNERLRSNLRVVYHQWMLCALNCTDNDVHLISLSLSSQSSDNKHVSNAFNANNAALMDKNDVSSDDENESGNEEVDQDDEVNALANRIAETTISQEKTKKQQARRVLHSMPTTNVTWAKAANDNQQKSKQERVPRQVTKSQRDNRAVIAPDKIAMVLPPSFVTISQEIRDFAMSLLKEGKLLPFQISVGLCQTLSLAESAPSKNRAKSILYKMAQQSSPVQLSNMDLVARYILGQNVDSKASTAKKSQQQPPTITTKNTREERPKRPSSSPVPTLNNVEYGGSSPTKRHGSLKRSGDACILS